MIAEEFRDVKGFEGLYQVSNLGRVRSLKYGKERIMKLGKNTKGYPHIILSKNGKHKTCKVHRLVAIAFIPNPDGLSEINHIDEDKTNNCVWNLEWCTRKYNINFGTRNEQISKRVYQYAKSGSFVRSYPSTHEAARQTGISQGNISECCNGNRNHTGGYVWSYDPPTPTTVRSLF